MPTRNTQSRSLPAKPSLEYLRKEAKRYSKLHGLNLVAAQRAIAHDYGHRNWAELMAAAKTVVQPAAGSTSAAAAVDSSVVSKLRDPQWAEILSLADVSLSELAVAPSSKEWLDNRRAFLDSGGAQHQFVATLGDRIVGYASVEDPPAWVRNTPAAGECRLFMVVEPSARRTLGTRLLEKLRESLLSLGARRAWFQEYEADIGLLSFLEEKGFVRKVSFQADDGTRIVRMSMDAPFDALKVRP